MTRVLLFLLLASSAVPTSAAAQRRPPRRPHPAEAPAPVISDLAEISAQLRSDNPDEVREAIDLLSVLDRPEAVPPLAALLRSGQPDPVADRALEALRGLASPSSIEVLVEMTRHRRPSARRRAFLALAAIDDPRIPALLAQGLRDSDRSVRGAVALALGDRHATETLDALFTAFERGVIEAAIAIGKLVPGAGVERFDAYLGQRPLAVMLSGYAPLLRRDDISAAVKRGIVEKLGEVAGPMVRRFLGEYLSTFPERDRSALKSLVSETIRRIPPEAAAAGGGA
ncbi:MAG: hypothetical protein GXP55_16585 [Deltaproteobacteria bacterium]|nr:hypothetical protein [Deltaproteobacteria bacterium]